jgi:lysophospholipase L1-like esterase
MAMRTRTLQIVGIALIAAITACVPAGAQLVPQVEGNGGPCCVIFAARNVLAGLSDWAQLGRYHADDMVLSQGAPDPRRVVFLGDSITDGWQLTQYFPGKPYVNRGISGQTTPQMLVRMMPDVLALRPAALIILAGTNDIAGNTGPETQEMIENNFRAMTELAYAHGIRVVLCKLTPVSDYTGRNQTKDRPPTDILALNSWIESYAKQIRAVVADYYSALVDSAGMLRAGYSDDGLHPNAQGYALLAPLAEAAIERAMSQPAPHLR